jgi:hypothetical protein
MLLVLRDLPVRFLDLVMTLAPARQVLSAPHLITVIDQTRRDRPE